MLASHEHLRPVYSGTQSVKNEQRHFFHQLTASEQICY